MGHAGEIWLQLCSSSTKPCQQLAMKMTQCLLKTGHHTCSSSIFARAVLLTRGVSGEESASTKTPIQLANS